MISENQREAPASVLRAVSPLWRLRRLIRDVRLLGFRFGIRHWRLQNRVDDERLLRFVRCIRRLGWKFGLRYWRMLDGLRDRPSGASGARFREGGRLPDLRQQLRGAEAHLTVLRERVRQLERPELEDRTSRA